MNCILLVIFVNLMILKVLTRMQENVSVSYSVVSVSFSISVVARNGTLIKNPSKTGEFKLPLADYDTGARASGTKTNKQSNKGKK